MRLARKHLGWYSRGLPGSAEFRAAVDAPGGAGGGDPAGGRVLRPADRARGPRADPRAGPAERRERGARAGWRAPLPRAGRGGDAAALPVPVALLDAENRFRFANQAAEQFFGVSVPQLGNLRLHDLLPPDSPIFLLIGQARPREARSPITT